MKGTIFNIQRYCTHDGPGIRTTVFFKGCPLRCLWCCNPEGLRPEIETIETVKRIGQKQFEVEEVIGKKYTPKALLKEILKDKIFFDESGGGVTFSGGEPTMQMEFLLEIMSLCKAEGLHVALDTEGYFDKKHIPNLVKYVDLFLFDFKHMNPHKHTTYTGVSNQPILENYVRLFNLGVEIMARMPVIPGYNDDPTNIKATANFLSFMDGNNFKGISLLPYHPFGADKYPKFNMKYLLHHVKTPAKERMIEIQKMFIEMGVQSKIGG